MAKFPVNTHRIDPYASFKFLVKWQSEPNGSFEVVAGVSKVGALKRTTEVISHSEGGDISTPRHSPGRSKFEPVMLERGITFDPEFEKWAKLVYSTECDCVQWTAARVVYSRLSADLSDEESNQERGASKQLAPQSLTRFCMPI